MKIKVSTLIPFCQQLISKNPLKEKIEIDLPYPPEQ